MFVFGVTGYSGSGKTTLIERLLPAMQELGQRVSVIKHAHHGFDIDRPGKDSYRHRSAGAEEVMLACHQRWALMHEMRYRPADDSSLHKNDPPRLEHLLARMTPCDLVLVEGFKAEKFPKLEVWRHGVNNTPLYPQRDDIVALATDMTMENVLEPLPPPDLTVLPLNDTAAIAHFIIDCKRSPNAIF